MAQSSEHHSTNACPTPLTNPDHISRYTNPPFVRRVLASILGAPLLGRFLASSHERALAPYSFVRCWPQLAKESWPNGLILRAQVLKKNPGLISRKDPGPIPWTNAGLRSLRNPGSNPRANAGPTPRMLTPLPKRILASLLAPFLQ